MKVFKLFLPLLLVALSMGFSSCAMSINQQMDLAEAQFIKEQSYMTEKEALSKEIDYYKAPEITYKEHTRSLTGKDLIHECNQIMEEDNNKDYIQFGSTSFKITRKVADIKAYALEHPNEIIANEFKFSGIFTHFGTNRYGERKAVVIVVPELDRYIVTPIY